MTFTIAPFSIHTPSDQLMTSPEAAILAFLSRHPFARQHEISDALKLPGDHHNWLTYACLRSLASRGLVVSELIPGPSASRRPIKVWRAIEPRTRKTGQAQPLRKRDIIRQWFSALSL